MSSDRCRLICASSSATLRRSDSLELRRVSWVCEEVSLESLTVVLRFLEATHRHIGHAAPGTENNPACGHHTWFHRLFGQPRHLHYGRIVTLTRLFLFLQFVQAREMRPLFLGRDV